MTPLHFFLAAVRCAYCSITICGTKYTCNRCRQVVHEACMRIVGSTVCCFSCTCCEASFHTVEYQRGHFRVHPDCTTNGIHTRCVERKPSLECAPNTRKFKLEWLLTCPWLHYNAVCVLMWCAGCRAYPRLRQYRLTRNLKGQLHTEVHIKSANAKRGIVRHVRSIIHSDR